MTYNFSDTQRWALPCEKFYNSNGFTEPSVSTELAVCCHFAEWKFFPKTKSCFLVKLQILMSRSPGTISTLVFWSWVVPLVVFCIPLRNCISEMLVLKPSFGGYGGVDSKLKIVIINSEKMKDHYLWYFFSLSELQNVI